MTRRRRIYLVGLALILAAALALCGAARAQLRTELRGYAKDLALGSRSVLSDDPYLLNLTRLRLQGLAYAGSRLHAEVWLDTEALAGSFVETPEYALGEELERPTWLDLDWTVAETDDLVLRQTLFRAFVTGYVRGVQLTAGRQRIAWGSGFVWNPTDLLNPVAPTAVERGEKAGVDALYAAVPLGALSRVEGAVAPGRDADRLAVAFRGTTNLREYDVALMGGTFRGDWVLGGDFAGYVGDAGFRGEAAYTRTDDGGAYLRAVLNADYSFPGDVYAFAELYHNGAGTRDKDEYDVLAALESDFVFGLGREYAAVSATKAVTPLWTAGVYALANLGDASGLAGPTVVWSAAEDLEVSASAYLFLGASDTEFGAQANAYFAAVQWYF